MSSMAELAPRAHAIPFDTVRLDALMDQAGIDVLIATSKHNVQYLTGGHRALFFDSMDAIGLSRYLPALVYPKGDPDGAAYVGHRLERSQLAIAPLWPASAQAASSGAVDAIELAAEAARGYQPRRIGVERAFLPLEAGDALARLFPDAALIDATYTLERLRAIKSPRELALLREASDRVVDAMLLVMTGHGPGTNKRDLVEALRREETARGLTFDYCLITAGRDLNRAPSEARWDKGETLSLDSGGNYHGYIGDVCRMAIQGEPDTELVDLLAEVDAVQQAAFAAIRAGAPGGDIYAAGDAALARSPHRDALEFVAHGMGLVSHEAPRLTNRGVVPYSDEDAHRPLVAGMVISVETTMHHPRRGFVKLEDTAAVTEAGHDLYGDRGRGWNRGGTAG